MRLLGLVSVVALIGLPAMSTDAAACSVTVYQHINFGGAQLHSTGSRRDLRRFNWNDQISSIQVHSGTWQFFEHIHFGGSVMRVGPGSYSALGGNWNDQISSF